MASFTSWMSLIASFRICSKSRVIPLVASETAFSIAFAESSIFLVSEPAPASRSGYTEPLMNSPSIPVARFE